MYEVRIQLNSAATLASLASPMPPAPAALPAGMPGPPGGIYLVLNTATATRYAGISTNTQNRFNGRMAVVNEFGMNAAAMAPLWAWWGTVQLRRIPPPPIFAASTPTAAAGFALANRYALPGPGTTVCAAPIPAVLAGHEQAALDAVVRPIVVAVGAFGAWNAIPAPKTVGNFNAAFLANMGFAPALGVAAAAVAQAGAANAASAAATAAGAPPAVAAAASAAIAAFAAGAVPPPSDVRTVVHSFFGGPAIPAAPAATPWVQRNPVHAGGHTSLSAALGPGLAVLNLEQAFIRFVLTHLGAGGFVANGVHIAPLGWPASPEPICVTWHSVAGGGFGVHNASVMWWGGTF